jgi:hypothetical protein
MGKPQDEGDAESSGMEEKGNIRRIVVNNAPVDGHGRGNIWLGMIANRKG